MDFGSSRTILFDGRMVVHRHGGLLTLSNGGSAGPSERFQDPNGVSWPVYRPLEPGDAFKRVTRIQLGGSKSYKFPCSGINLIFVQGKKSVCVATCDMNKDQDRTETKKYLLNSVAGLADFKLYTARMYKQPIDLEPCAAVSVLFDSSTSSSGEEAAISLLKKGLESGSTESLTGTVQVAISALQSFYHMKKLEADEIEVCVTEVDGCSSLLTRDEIAGYLGQL